MLKKILFPALVALALTNATPTNAIFGSANKEEARIEKILNRTPHKKAKFITINLPADATVADLFTTTHRKNMGFNVPTMPQTANRSPLLPAPMSMQSYKLYQKLNCGAYVTTAGVLRFLQDAHLLFYDKENRRLKGNGVECQNAIRDAIAAHKTWYDNQTTETRLALNKKETIVMNILAQLPLSNPKVKRLVENLLSTSTDDHNRFLNRAATAFKNKYSKTMIAHPNGFFKTCFKNGLVNTGVAAGTLVAAFIIFITQDEIKHRGDSLLYCLRNDTSRLENNFDNHYFKKIHPRGCQQNAQGCNCSQTEPSNGLIVALAATVVAIAGPFIWNVSKDVYDWKTDYNLTPEPNGGINVMIRLNDQEAE